MEVFKCSGAPYRNGRLLKLLLQNAELPKMIEVIILGVALLVHFAHFPNSFRVPKTVNFIFQNRYFSCTSQYLPIAFLPLLRQQLPYEY